MVVVCKDPFNSSSNHLSCVFQDSINQHPNWRQTWFFFWTKWKVGPCNCSISRKQQPPFGLYILSSQTLTQPKFPLFLCIALYTQKCFFIITTWPTHIEWRCGEVEGIISFKLKLHDLTPLDVNTLVYNVWSCDNLVPISHSICFTCSLYMST